jgi:hypothetical protein
MGIKLIFMGNLSYFHNVKSPKTNITVSSEEWFSMIKHSDYSRAIQAARNGELDYESVKTTMVPAVTYNFTYNKYKKDENILSATGLFYLDIDNPDFNPNLISMDKVRAMYKSFGGNGYAIVVEVEGLTPKNFESTYWAICEDLGITQYIDKGAKKASQYNVLSYDPDLQENKTPKTYKGTSGKTTEKSVTQTTEKKGIKHIYTDGATEEGLEHLCGNLPLRFTNASDNVADGDKYLVDFQGREEIKCWIPPRKLKEGRNSVLLSYATNLIILNPFLDFCRAKDVLDTVNNAAFKEPVKEDQITRVLRTVFDYKEAGTLQPHFSNKKRKIMFAMDSGMSKEEKNGIVIKALSDMRRNNSLEKLQGIVDNWDTEKYGKMSQRKIAKNFEISLKTVNKYMREILPA